jgi:uncharacterized protein YnzC (UPF0291/DUF896 family)
MVIKMNVNQTNLGELEMMNASANLNYKGIPPITKGAGSQYLLGNEAYVECDQNFGEILHQSKLFIWQKKNEIVSNITEFWEYENLPVDKYNFEKKLLDNGVLAAYKVADEILFSPFTVDKYDIYDRPLEIEINEKTEYAKIKLGIKKFATIRSEISEQGIYPRILRYLNIMEKVLYALEDNLTSAKPKGILVTNGAKINSPTNQDVAEGLESIVNSQNTFFEVNMSDIENVNNFSFDGNGLWIPIELRDRSEELIRYYNFLNEKLKELFGLGVNILSSKKERLVTDEIDQQQKVSNANILHMYNIRKTDIENINKVLKTNIKIKRVDEMWNDLGTSNIDKSTKGEGVTDD